VQIVKEKTGLLFELGCGNYVCVKRRSTSMGHHEENEAKNDVQLFADSIEVKSVHVFIYRQIM
jgi:hypothetical protein